jgi:hypothetical protein
MSRRFTTFAPSLEHVYNGVSVYEDGLTYIYVGVESEHDPSFEVRTALNISLTPPIYCVTLKRPI